MIHGAAAAYTNGPDFGGFIAEQNLAGESGESSLSLSGLGQFLTFSCGAARGRVPDGAEGGLAGTRRVG